MAVCGWLGIQLLDTQPGDLAGRQPRQPLTSRDIRHRRNHTNWSVVMLALQRNLLGGISLAGASARRGGNEVIPATTTWFYYSPVVTYCIVDWTID